MAGNSLAVKRVWLMLQWRLKRIIRNGGNPTYRAYIATLDSQTFCTTMPHRRGREGLGLWHSYAPSLRTDDSCSGVVEYIRGL